MTNLLSRSLIAFGALGISVATMAGDPASHDIIAHDAWIRVLPGALPAGGYVRLHNDAGRSVRLVGARSKDYGQVMLHRSVESGGHSSMQAVGAVTIPAHGEAVLKPGGYHLMLMQPRHPVKPGHRVTVTLTFGDGSWRDVSFLARPANAAKARGP